MTTASELASVAAFRDMTEEGLAQEIRRLKRERNTYVNDPTGFNYGCYDRLVKLAEGEAAHRVRRAMGL